MAQGSYYDILGVSASAPVGAIRLAYREIARLTHPDFANGDLEKIDLFRKATEAYKTLSDPEKRKKYDRGHIGIRSVKDLFFKTDVGRRHMEAMLPSAPAAQRRGYDQVIVLDVEQHLLEEGGVVLCTLDSPYGESRTDVPIQIPVDAIKYPWCRVEQYGGKGKNGAQFGDLLILFRTKHSRVKQG